MIIKVTSMDDCKICDKFLTLLIRDERQYDNTIDENFVAKDYFANMIHDENILLLYKKETVPMGYVFAKKREEDYLIDGLYVDTSFRNQGIAKKLIKEVIKEINSLGNYKISINVLTKNKVAISLYQTMGFLIEKETELRYSMVYPQYHLVNASQGDIERIKKYKLKSILDYANNLELCEIERIKDYVNKTICNQIEDYQNIVLKDDIVGSFLLTEIEDGILLDEIFIKEKYRNQGIGTMIIKDIIKNTEENLYLWVYKDNMKATKLYHRLGFHIKDETDSRYYMEYRK